MAVKMKLIYLFFALNQIEQLSLFGIFEDNEDVRACVDKLKVLDDVWMVEFPEYFDLTLDLFKDALQLNLSLIQNLDGHLVICDLVHRHYRQNKCEKTAIKLGWSRTI